MNYIKSILLATGVLGCGRLTVKDFTACAITPGQSGAVCDGYLTSHQTILDQSEWLALSPGYFCVSPKDYGNMKIELEQACTELKCSYEQKQAMSKFFLKLERLRK